MKTVRRYAVRLLVVALCCWALALPAVAGPGDAVYRAAGLVDAIGKVDPGALPFNGDQLRAMDDLITQCDASSSADDVVACVDGGLKSGLADDVDVPTWLPKALDIYLDIEHNDFWGLVEDSALEVACIVATAITDGVDVCGAVKELIAAAEEIAADAVAVAKFLADVGTTIADAGKSIYCWFAGCDDSAPQVSAADDAYQRFFLPRLPIGLAKRLTDKPTWDAYVGSAASTNSPGIYGYDPAAVHFPAATQFTPAALAAALPRFAASVYQQWDVKALALTSQVKAAGSTWNSPAKAQSYVGPGMAAWKPEMTSQLDFGTGLAPLLAPGRTACAAAIVAAGGPQVDAWIAEDRPKASGLSAKGFHWDYGTSPHLCAPFESYLRGALRAAVIVKASAFVQSVCPQQIGTPPRFACGNAYVMDSCKSLMAFEGAAPSSCFNVNVNPGIIALTCNSPPYIRHQPVTAPRPKGCSPAKVGSTPPPGAGNPL